MNVRIIAATNINLQESIKDGLFREDLFFRLSVIPIYLPALRERKEDIALLATHFLQQYCDSHSRNIKGIAPETLKKLMDYSWPGNIRELQNTIEYAMHIADDGGVINNDHLPVAIAGILAKETYSTESMSIDDFIRHSIVTLQEENNEEKIAEILGISRKNLWEKRKKWGISRKIKNDS